MGEYYAVKGGLRQGCVIFHWNFNGFFDRMIRLVRLVRLVNLGGMRKGMKLRGVGGKGREINDDAVSMGESREDLQHFGRMRLINGVIKV